MASSFIEDATLSTLECVRVLRWLGFEIAATDETTVTMRRHDDPRTVVVPRGQAQLPAASLAALSAAAGTTVEQLLALAQPRFKSDVMPRVTVPTRRRFGPR